MEKIYPRNWRLPHEFASRDALSDFIAQLDNAPDEQAVRSHPAERRASPIIGGRKAALCGSWTD